MSEPMDPCAWCGAEMPIGKRLDAIYCSVRCKQKAYDAFVRAEREREKAGRPCAHCGKPIAPQKRRHAQYCSRTCLEAARWKREKAARGG